MMFILKCVSVFCLMIFKLYHYLKFQSSGIEAFPSRWRSIAEGFPNQSPIIKKLFNFFRGDSAMS